MLIIKSAIPYNLVEPMHMSVPKFVDPRTVADCPHPTTEERSSISSPISDSRHSDSRSASPLSNEVCFNPDGISMGPHLFKYSDAQFNYPSYIADSSTVTSYIHNSSNPPRPLDSQIVDDVPRLNLTIMKGDTSDNKELSPPQSPSLRKRGPGRPSKVQSAAQFTNNKRPTGHSAVKLRRQMHNDSAMRSRARLNKALEELWAVVPKNERIVQPENGNDDCREVCRAVKVEVAISYLRKLQGQLAVSGDETYGV
jgi:hypothetical protein